MDEQVPRDKEINILMINSFLRLLHVVIYGKEE